MRRDVEKRIKDTLAKNHACYILITCDEPTEDGQMQINLTYEGPATIASYMLQDAQSYINEQEEAEQPVIFQLSNSSCPK
jgi:hypothetical protein